MLPHSAETRFGSAIKIPKQSRIRIFFFILVISFSGTFSQQRSNITVCFLATTPSPGTATTSTAKAAATPASFTTLTAGPLKLLVTLTRLLAPLPVLRLLLQSLHLFTFSRALGGRRPLLLRSLRSLLCSGSLTRRRLLLCCARRCGWLLDAIPAAVNDDTSIKVNQYMSKILYFCDKKTVFWQRCCVTHLNPRPLPWEGSYFGIPIDDY